MEEPMPNRVQLKTVDNEVAIFSETHRVWNHYNILLVLLSFARFLTTAWTEDATWPLMALPQVGHDSKGAISHERRGHQLLVSCILVVMLFSFKETF